MFDDIPPIRALFEIGQLKGSPPAVKDVVAIDATLGNLCDRCCQVGTRAFRSASFSHLMACIFSRQPDPEKRPTPFTLLRSSFLKGRDSSIDLLVLDNADDNDGKEAEAPAATNRGVPPLQRSESELERRSLLAWLQNESVQLGAARGALKAMRQSGKSADEWLKQNFDKVKRLVKANDVAAARKRRQELRAKRQKMRLAVEAQRAQRNRPQGNIPVPQHLTLKNVTVMRTMRVDRMASVAQFNMSDAKAELAGEQRRMTIRRMAGDGDDDGGGEGDAEQLAMRQARAKNRRLLRRTSVHFNMDVSASGRGDSASGSARDVASDRRGQLAVPESGAAAGSSGRKLGSRLERQSGQSLELPVQQISEKEDSARRMAEWQAEQERLAAEARKEEQKIRDKIAHQRQLEVAKWQKQQLEAARKAKEEAEAKAKQEAKAKKEAEIKAKKAAEAKAKKDAEAKAKKEAEAREKAKAKKEAEAKAKKEAEAKAKKEAEGKAKKEAEAKAKKEAEAKAKKEAEAKAKKEAEAKAKKEAEAKAKKEAEAKAQKEAEAKAKKAERKEKRRSGAHARPTSSPKASPKPPRRGKSPMTRKVAAHVVVADDIDEELTLMSSEEKLLAAVDKLRRDPAHFAKLIEKERIPNYDEESNALVLGNVGWQTFEGKAAAEEAVVYLRSLSRLPPLEIGEGMVKAARRALLASVDQPKSLKLLPQYGGAAGALEQLVAFGFTEPNDIIMTLVCLAVSAIHTTLFFLLSYLCVFLSFFLLCFAQLIADGNPTRHSRIALCSKAIGTIGVAVAPHDEMDQVTLISLAEVWADGLFEE